jgi:hypothetical protein
VAEGARLESVYTGNRIVGSNPTPSAIKLEKLKFYRGIWRSLLWCPINCPSTERDSASGTA